MLIWCYLIIDMKERLFHNWFNQSLQQAYLYCFISIKRKRLEDYELSLSRIFDFLRMYPIQFNQTSFARNITNLSTQSLEDYKLIYESYLKVSSFSGCTPFKFIGLLSCTAYSHVEHVEHVESTTNDVGSFSTILTECSVLYIKLGTGQFKINLQESGQSKPDLIWLKSTRSDLR